MKKKVSSLSIIRAIMGKDLKAYSRDKVWAILTPLVLVAMIIVFWVLPNTVNETIVLGVHQSGMDDIIKGLQKENSGDEGLFIVEFDSAKKMADVITDGKKVTGPDGKKVGMDIGVDFGSGFMENVASGKPTEVDVYVSSDIPAELRTAITAYVREISYSIAGDTMPVSYPKEDEIILGEDRVGRQVPLRNMIRPIMVFMVLLTEAFALSALIATEIRKKTVQALVVTPASTIDVITAKTTSGTLMSFGQAVFLLVFTASFTARNWPLLLVTALLGAILIAGVGMLSGSVGRDFIGTLFVGMAFMIPMIIPAFAVLFPGTQSLWVKIIPSYGFIQSIVGVAAYGDGWAETLPYLGITAAWSFVLCMVGVIALQRKVATL